MQADQKDTTKSNESKEGQSLGLLQLVTSTVLWAAFPVVAVLSSSSRNPILAVILWSGGAGVGTSLYLFLKQRKLFTKGYRRKLLALFLNKKSVHGDEKVSPAINIIRERSALLPFLRFDVLLFAWALKYITPTVAAAVFQSWPLLFILARKRTKLLAEKCTNSDSYNLSSRDLYLNIFAIAAVSLIFLADMPSEGSQSAFGVSSIFGFLLLLSAIILTIQSAPQELQVKLFTEKVLTPEEKSSPGWDEFSVQYTHLYIEVLGRITLVTICAVLLIIFKLFNIADGFFESLAISSQVLLFVFGMLVSAGGSFLALTAASKKTKLPGISVEFLTPILSVFYILAIYPISNLLSHLFPNYTYSVSHQWPLLIVGLLGITFASIVIYFKSENGVFGLTSLIVSLWVFGFLVYFRDSWSWWVENIVIHPNTSLEYYSLLALATTAFALLIAFEVSRMEARITREEDLLLSLLGCIQNYKTYKKEALTSLVEFDSTTDPEEMRGYYREIHALILKNEATDSSKSISKLNTLAQSKQQDQLVSGTVAISLLAVFIVTLLVLLRPANVAGLTAVLVDSFAFLLSGVVTYLIFHLADLKISRKRTIIDDKSDVCYVEFITSASRTERVAASVLVAVVGVTYFFLYVAKWILAI